ncbi:MAG: DUF362 domain-containing protein [Nanoarchaeota archaeon]|nr:DUF362 domain-containing protein [Nanoarchaeota archaeon]
MEIEKVSIVKCKTYNQKQVDSAVKKALILIDFKFKKNMNVLIKPNVVGSFPHKQIACTTNPKIIESVCKILKKNKCNIIIGDSPFTNPEQSFKASGIDKVAKKYGKVIIFEQSKLIDIKDKKAKVLKNFKMSSMLKDVDLIINMPKLKTHTLTKYTGAIKNLYGCIPGGIKQQLHNKAQGDEKFSDILIDIYQNVKPELNIMDGVIGMEGEGPTSGNSVNSGVIMASKNSIALDIACSKMIGYNPKDICAIKHAIDRKLYPDYKFELVGDKLPKLNFKKPTLNEMKNSRKMIKGLFKETPIICDTTKCVKCGLCAKRCPAHAIILKPYPTIDKKKCIRCFCCMEICPQHAIFLKQN